MLITKEKAKITGSFDNGLIFIWKEKEGERREADPKISPNSNIFKENSNISNTSRNTFKTNKPKPLRFSNKKYKETQRIFNQTFKSISLTTFKPNYSSL